MATSGVGETLRHERTSRQLGLEEISRATKISTRFLHAIETEDFGTLPGLIFTRNFVRQYASFMNLDPEPLLAMVPRFDLESAPMPQPPYRPRRTLWDPRWNSAFASVAWTVLASGAAVGAYLHFNSTSHVNSTSHSGSAPKAVATVQAAVLQPAQTPAAQPAPTPPPDIHPVQVLVAAREESWVQAIADGKPVFATMLKAGETRAIAADEHVKVRTGNAGGIEISLNGKALDPLGPSGQIRSVTLTAAGPLLPSAAPAGQTPPVESSPF